MGLDGKTLIHPSQIAHRQCRFRSDRSAKSAAREAIIAAFSLPENAGKGAIQLDGRMVERLHAEMARRTLSIAEGIAALVRRRKPRFDRGRRSQRLETRDAKR